MATAKEIYEQLGKLLKENPEIANMEILEGGGESARLNIFRDNPDGPVTYLSFEDEKFMESYVEQAKELVSEMNIGELSEQHMEYLVQMCLQEYSKDNLKQYITDFAVSPDELNKNDISSGYIKINDDITLSELKLHEKGDMTGYVTGQVEVDGYSLELLYRVKDKENGEPMSMVSIDYGYNHPTVREYWADIEKAVESFAVAKIIENQPEFYYSNILTEENINVEDFEYDSSDGLFSSYLGTYFDTDNKFGIDLSNDNVWLNMYGIYNAETDSLTVECTIISEDRDSHTFVYIPAESEKTVIYNAMNNFCIKEYSKTMIDVCKEIILKETELTETDYIFDDGLYGCQDKNCEEVDGYIWATDALVKRLEVQVKKEQSPKVLETMENINFYPCYNLRTGEITLNGSYDYYKTEEDKIPANNTFILPLSDKEKAILIFAMETYCQKTYNQSCLVFVNEGRAEVNLPSLPNNTASLNAKIQAASNRVAGPQSLDETPSKDAIQRD